MLRSNIQAKRKSVSKDVEIVHRVGYYWQLSKENKSPFNTKELETLLQKENVELVRIDFEKSLEDQGPFAVIIHKMVDLIAKATLGNEKAKRYLVLLRNYIEQHPGIHIIDPLDNIETMISRLEQYEIVQRFLKKDLPSVFLPSFIELVSVDKKENLEKMASKGIEFPIICKPLLAQGTRLAHELTIVFSPSGFESLKVPCVAQELITHTGVLYKMYITGDAYNIIEKPSIKNKKGTKHPNIHFTHHACKSSVNSSLTRKITPETKYPPDKVLSKSLIAAIFKSLPKIFGLDLLSFDLIVESKSGRHAIIDVNMFPGYAEVKDLMPRFRDLILSKIRFSTSPDFPALPTLPVLPFNHYSSVNAHNYSPLYQMNSQEDSDSEDYDLDDLEY